MTLDAELFSNHPNLSRRRHLLNNKIPKYVDRERRDLSRGFHSERRCFLRCSALAAAGVSSGLLPRIPAAMEGLSQSVCVEKSAIQEPAGKVAFVTGGSTGIGLGIVRAFVEAGMKVAIGYRTPRHIEAAMDHFCAARDRVIAISVDVTDRRGMERAATETVKAFGRVHVLVNNAGVGTLGTLSQTTYDDWDWVVGVNITGVFNAVHAFLPHIQRHGEGGHIMTTSSVFGLVALPNMGGYSASKYAVVGLMEALRAELAQTNIGVSVFCPGAMRSGGWDADRNRPQELGDVGVRPDSAMIARDKAMRLDPEVAMDPLEAGRLVLRGMRENQLYVLTHPEYDQIIKDRNEALIASMPHDLQPTEKRLAIARSVSHGSIYARERDRMRCTDPKRAER